jgi:hypothetical protein
MSTNDIINILPNPLDNIEGSAENPYNILCDYASAFAVKYPKKINAMVIQNTHDDGHFQYIFMVLAKIGRGYSKQLLEVKTLSDAPYPVSLTVLLDKVNTSMESPNIITTKENLENELKNVFQNPFVKMFISNLFHQVDAYKETREE